MNRAAWFARLLRAEGVSGVAARCLDRAAEWRWRRTFRLRADRLDGERGEWPILLVSAAAPAVRLGGVQAQLASRLAASDAPWALLHRDGGRYRLIAATGTRRRSALDRPASPQSAAGALDDGELEAAVHWALGATGAHAVQVEGAAGLPLRALLRIARAVPTLLAVHDFSLFCTRAHLLERPADVFCGWCRDAERCTGCLRAAGEGVDAAHLEERREVARQLLAVVRAVIFPSDFVRDRHAELFPPTAGVPRRVIAPAPPAGPAPIERARARRGRPCVAFVGAAQVHKGAAVFEAMAGALRTMPEPPRLAAYGGGDAATLVRWRRLGVAVHGYYRAGTLSARLARDEIDVAVLPSVVPESYSLVLSECRRAKVPIVAFDFGAIAERVRAGGGGRLVPLADGAAGIAAAVAEELRDATAMAPSRGGRTEGAASPSRTRAPLDVDAGGADARRAVAAWAALHRELDLVAENRRE